MARLFSFFLSKILFGHGIKAWSISIGGAGSAMDKPE